MMSTPCRWTISRRRCSATPRLVRLRCTTASARSGRTRDSPAPRWQSRDLVARARELQALDRQIAAVDDEGRAGHVARLVRCQEEDDVGDLARLSDAAERVRALDPLEEVLDLGAVHAREVAAKHGRVDRAGYDRVHADPVAADLRRERPRR